MSNMREAALPDRHDRSVASPWTPEEIAKAKKFTQGPGPFYFGEQVTNRLHALDKEWDRIGGFDPQYMEAFLEQLDEIDPPHYVARSRTT